MTRKQPLVGAVGVSKGLSIGCDVEGLSVDIFDGLSVNILEGLAADALQGFGPHWLC